MSEPLGTDSYRCIWCGSHVNDTLKAALPIELKGASADLDELERWLEDRYDRADDGSNPEVGFLATVQRVKRTLESAARKVSE